jgi:hypothetical protein
VLSRLRLDAGRRNQQFAMIEEVESEWFKAAEAQPICQNFTTPVPNLAALEC